jgi:outer membrane protein assembly factor BamA
MNAFLISVALCCSGANSPSEVVNSSMVEAKALIAKKPPRVGMIFVIGNDRTRQDVILKQVGLYPGQIIDWAEVYRSERRLARLNIFKYSPDGAVRPTIWVQDDPNNPDSEYKDVIILVTEDNTATAMLTHRVNDKGERVIGAKVEERNLDPLRIPISRDDLFSGKVFRGAGLALGLDIEVKLSARPSATRVSLGMKLPIFSQR